MGNESDEVPIHPQQPPQGIHRRKDRSLSAEREQHLLAQVQLVVHTQAESQQHRLVSLAHLVHLVVHCLVIACSPIATNREAIELSRTESGLLDAVGSFGRRRAPQPDLQTTRIGRPQSSKRHKHIPRELLRRIIANAANRHASPNN